MKAMAVEMVILEAVVGTVIGLICKFISDRLEQYLLRKRNLEVRTSKLENIIVLIIAIASGIAILIKFQLVIEIIYAFTFLIICITISLIDIHYRIIPNGLLLGLLVIKVLVGVPGVIGIEMFPDWDFVLSLVGLVAGFVVFVIPGALGKKIGAGDVKLAACAGFCLGLDGLLYSVVLMGLGVLAYSMVQTNKALRNMMLEMIPMGPFLSVSMLLVLLVK